MVSSDQRRRQLAREKFLRQQQRREVARRRARTRNASVAAALVVVVGGGAGLWAGGAFEPSKDTKDSAADAPSATPSKAPDPCDKAAKGKPGKLTWKKEPPVTVDKSATYTLDLKTTCGDMPITMSAAKAPHTVNSFAFLAKKGFFDHTKCHRLVTNGIYVLQCGDPTGTGSGGPGYTIPDENLKDKSLKSEKIQGQKAIVYPAGTVAMANQYNPQTKSGKNSGGSQFFLVYKDSPLPGAYYAPFGTLSKGGMKVLQKIAKAGETDANPQAPGDGTPNATVVINKATVTKS